MKTDYKFLSLIGKGGFSYVYKALHLPTKQLRAVKLIPKKKVQQLGLWSRVRKEIEIQSSLKHPSILHLYEWFEDTGDGYIYLATELCQYELFQILKTRGKITEEEARFLLVQIVNGLLYLHSNGVLHRDLKLSNILLTNEMHVKIADFGLAVSLENANPNDLTICGTPNYISPEVINREKYGFESDVWALGCLLYTLLVGQSPFESQGIRDTLVKVKRGEFKFPSGLTSEAMDLIQQMLQINTRDRIPLAFVLNHSFFKHKTEVLRVTSAPVESQKAKVVPISVSSRIKPIKQQIKHGLIELNERREVVVDFKQDRNILIIDTNTKRIRTRNKLTLAETDVTESLDQDAARQYKYAEKFIQVLKSKYAKVELLTPDCKAQLMENDDVVISFTSSASWKKLKLLLNKGQIELTDTRGQTRSFNVNKFDNVQSAKIDVLDVSLDAFASRVLKECVEYFKRYVQEHNDPSQYPVTINLTQNLKDTITNLSLLTVTQPSQTFTTRTETLYSKPAVSSKQSQFKFLDSVGWCVQTPAGNDQYEFQLLFIDGTRIVIEPGSGNCFVTFFDASGRMERWPIDKYLPSYIKQKLQHFPAFVK